MTIWEKIISMFRSRRFLVAVGGVLTVLFQDVLGLSPEQAQAIVE